MFADNFYDPSQELKPKEIKTWSPSVCEIAKLGDLVKAHDIVDFAAQIPRRLGGDATPAQLAEDRRQLRKAKNMLASFLDQWVRIAEMDGIHFGEGVTDDVRRQAAQLNLVSFMNERNQIVTSQRARWVTHALQAGQRQWANKAAHLLNNEIGRTWAFCE